MKAVVVHPDAHTDLVDIPVPEISAGSALLKTQGCGVCGTDLLKINSRLLTAPTVLGHELVGSIVQTGDGVSGFTVGDRVVSAHHVPCFECHYCRHGDVSMCQAFKTSNFVPGGFAEYVFLSPAHLAHVTFKIPPAMPWQEALFTEPLACCVRDVNRLGLLPGDTVVMIGLGSIGLTLTALLNHRGIKIVGVDLDAKRCEIAKDFGASAVFTGTSDAAFTTALSAFTEGRGADGVIFTAGPTALLSQSPSWIRNGGFLNLFSHLSGKKCEVDAAEWYHREIRVLTTYSASPESLKESFELLKTDALKLRRMLAAPYAPDNFGRAVSDLNERRVLKAMIAFDP
jgi:L-iditol 2-dehydrogenase